MSSNWCMDAETLDRVFEPFFTTKGAGKGTGLGLSQVYGFASQSGGEVQAHSEVGRGTTVSLLLPCEDDSDSIARIHLGERTSASHRSATILVVEDNDEVGVFAESLLSEMGHKVTRTSSGEDALELSRTQDFDLVFSDVVMKPTPPPSSSASARALPTWRRSPGRKTAQHRLPVRGSTSSSRGRTVSVRAS